MQDLIICLENIWSDGRYAVYRISPPNSKKRREPSTEQRARHMPYSNCCSAVEPSDVVGLFLAQFPNRMRGLSIALARHARGEALSSSRR